MSTRSPWTALGCVAIVLSGLLACKKKPPPLTLRPTTKTAVGRFYKLTVESAKQCVVEAKHLQPRKGFVLLGVDLTFEPTTDETVALHSHEFSLIGPTGETYKTSLAECAPAIEQGVYIDKNRRLRGIMTFEVPESTFALTLVNKNMISPAKGMDEVSIQLSR